MCNVNEYIINKKNLSDNVTKIRRYVGNRTQICAVVKANAYGLGVKNVCPIIDDEVDFYAVVSVMEALEVRDISPTKPILILGSTDLAFANTCAEKNIRLSISSADEVEYLNKNLDRVIKVHLKLNTGMNRYGVSNVRDLKNILKKISESDKIVLEGVYTHFATKSSDVKFIDTQYEKLQKFLTYLPKKGLIVHCASSYVTLSDRQKFCNMVRVGFSLYSGFYERLNIKDVVSIKARVMYVHTVNSGESIGYDRTYVAKCRRKIAICSMGYADGFARNLSNNFKVLINGSWASVVGRVCMDCFMADVTDIKNVYVGTGVTILGKDGDHEITLQDIAEKADFSAYEVLLNFRQRRMNVVLKE